MDSTTTTTENSFELIIFQEALAERMLAMPSFTRRFAGKPSNGSASLERDRVYRAACGYLGLFGYTSAQAWHIVRDIEDYADSLFGKNTADRS